MKKKIGAQLFTVRDFCQTRDGFENTLKRLREIGYQAVQISAVGPIPPEDLKALCDRYGMEIYCTHKPVDAFLKQTEDVIQYHKTLGCPIAGLGHPGDHLSDPERFVVQLNQVTEQLKKEGIIFLYHHHALEFQRLPDGQVIFEYLEKHAKFGFIVDVYWLAIAGMNPAAVIRRLGSRAQIIHFKDLAVFGNDACMAEVMEGNLNWDEIFAACEEAGCQAALVEQDICRRDPFESLAISYRNLKTKGFC